MATYTQGQTRMAPGNRLGIGFDEGTSLDDALLEARLLGWNLRLAPTFAIDGEGEDMRLVEVPDKFSIVGDDPYQRGEVMVTGNDVTDDYTIVTNEQVAEFLSDVLDVSQGALMPQAGGSYRNGTHCFLNLRRPEGVLIGGSDLIQQDLFAHWGHDGGTAITIQAKSLRMFCTNQISGMLGDRTAPKFKVRHVGGAHEGRVAEARQALSILFEGQSEFEKEAERWAAKAVTDRQFDAIVEGLLPSLSTDDVLPAQVTRRMSDQETLRAIYQHDPTRGTAWGALNAWTEMGDWYGQQKDEEARAFAQLHSVDLERRRQHGAEVVADLMGLAA